MLFLFGALFGFAVTGLFAWVYVSALKNDVEQRERDIDTADRRLEAKDLQIESLRKQVETGKGRERLLKADAAEVSQKCGEALDRVRAVVDQIERGD